MPTDEVVTNAPVLPMIISADGKTVACADELTVVRAFKFTLVPVTLGRRVRFTVVRVSEVKAVALQLTDVVTASSVKVEFVFSEPSTMSHSEVENDG